MAVNFEIHEPFFTCDISKWNTGPTEFMGQKEYKICLWKILLCKYKVVCFTPILEEKKVAESHPYTNSMQSNSEKVVNINKFLEAFLPNNEAELSPLQLL